MNILCFGDSNTHGYNPKDGTRFEKNVRWTGILQNLLGNKHYVIEEGLSGRTTVFEDPIHEGLSGFNYIYPCLMTHEPIDLLIIMLGTNDTKERFGASASVISLGLYRLIKKAQEAKLAFRNNNPNILIVAPLPIRPEINTVECYYTMGKGCSEKSYEIISMYEKVANELGCQFFNPSPYAICSDYDYMHLDEKAHNILANKLHEFIKSGW
ncbi:MAG: GDSL-type esterase/lipase family protein [Romboutsia sp.]|uniref:GDSL-type esterase/lipase family protein n=1 Tax=Romboutsia sp. TaxID=1965302 RepID=UPI003F35E19D